MRTFLVLSIAVLTILLPRMEANTQSLPCGTDTLQNYEDKGSCELGGGNGGILVFSNFTFSATSSGSPIILDASQITVTPDPEGLGGGFIFDGFNNAPVLAGQTATYDIQYSYFIDAGPVSSGADIGMDPPFGNVSITESICADSIFVQIAGAPLQCEIPNDPFAPQTFSVDDTNPPTSWTNHLDLNPMVMSFASIDDTIFLNGGTDGAHFDNLTATSTVVNPTPEPLTLLTTLGGLLAIGFLRRRAECG
jgi:hypothetical protein